MFSLQQTTGPAIEPITLAEAKAQMRVTITDDDAYIGTLIAAARSRIENITGRCLVSQKWTLFLDSFPGTNPGPYPYEQVPPYQTPPYFSMPLVPILKDPRAIILPIGPVTAIDSIKTVDEAGAEATFAAAIGYIADCVSIPARVKLKRSAEWPLPAAGLAEVNGVRVAFTVGYPTAAGTPVTATTPEDLKAAMKLLVAHYYENREDATTLSLTNIPNGVAALVAPYKMWQRET